MPVRIPGVVFGRFEREHPERDIKTVATQLVPAGPQQDLQRAEQHGQRGIRRCFTRATATAEHGQVAIGKCYRPVADIAGGVERFTSRLQVIIPAVQDAP